MSLAGIYKFHEGSDPMKILKKCGKVLLIVVIIIVLILIIGLLLLEFYPSVGDTPNKEKQKEYEEKTNLYYEKQFHNELDFEVITGEASPTSDRTVPENKLPAEKLESIERAKSGEMKITWLGHSSSLLQMGDNNILIDPVMSDRASPVVFAGPERFAEYALDTDSVPEIDVLFISHDHYDHLDYDTIKAIDRKVSNYVVPLGVDVILKGWGIDESKLHPLYWWESIELDGVSYTVTPAEHYTGRNPLKTNATLWGGLYIKDGTHSFYYTGDTGYYDLFEQVYDKLGAPDLMLADSGQYDKGWATTHMFPEEAVRAAKDVHAKWLIPVHWGAYSLSNHAWDDPPQRAVKEAGDQNVNLATPRIGQIVNYDDIASFTEHWWEEYK